MHRGLLIIDVLIHLWFSAAAAECPIGRFGADCSGVCHCLRGPEFCDLGDGRCKEGPCKPGWTNFPLCQTECPKGFFGLNCTWNCHCNTAEECNAVNGHCASNECASGWIGPSCQNRMPVLDEAPVVKSINNSQVTLTWAAYEHSESSENISISSYQVQMLREPDDDWMDVDNVSVSSDIEEYSITTPKLELNKRYKFRVTIVWLNSNKPQISEPGPETDWVQIACREPTESVTSLKFSIMNRRTDTLKISWQSPVGDSGCERYAFLIFNWTCNPQCEPLSHKVPLPSSSTFVVISQRNRSSSTLVTMRVQAFNNAGLGSQKISTLRLRLLPYAQYDSADNSSGLVYSKEINLDTSGVASVEDTSTISTDVVSTISTDVVSTISTDVVSTISTDVVSTISKVVSTTEYVTKAPVITTDSTVTAAITTEHEHRETVFNASIGAIDLGTDAITETSSTLANSSDHLFNVISTPYSPAIPTHKQQKRYQLLKRSQHMMSFREIPSEQSSGDSTATLQPTARKVESVYADDSIDRPETSFDSSRSVVVSNLKPGTLYQVNVYSNLSNSSETMLVFSVSHWTLLLAPPKLSPPQIIDIQNTSITLKADLPRMARRALATDGIAFGILVVVEPDLNDGSRFKALTESADVLVHDAVAVSSKDNRLQGYRSKGATPYYVAVQVDDPPRDGVVVVGDGRISGKRGEYYNVPLVSDTRYWLWMGLTSSLDGVIQLALTPIEYPVRTSGAMSLQMMKLKEDDETESDEGLGAGSVAAIVLGVILLFLILCLIGIWWYKYKERTADPPATPAAPTYRPSSELTDKNLDTVFAAEVPREPVEEVQPERRKTQENTFDASFYVMKANHPIPVGRLRHHYETHLRPNSHYALQDEFRRLPDGLTDTTNVANLPYNVSLNRSQAIAPYDKNRVKLARQYPNDSTYINASYIRTIGYRSCIVTQCPVASTINEFWRMVWEMQVGTIVMLIESRESNGSEYYHYWPRKSKPIYYGDVKVQLMREDKLAHHEVREFRLSCTNEKVEVRRVIQWQYVQWKPGGIPDHPIPFLNMVAAIQEERDPESGFVIHCLKGGGRSGIYAAVDALVNEGKQSGKVDVLECVTLLRLERVCLVKSLKQYRFVYHCLIEAFNCHETRSPVHRFHFMLANLLARNELDSLTRFEKEYCAVQQECHAVRPYMSATSFGTRFGGTRFSSPDHRELECTEGARRMSDGTRNYGVLPCDNLVTTSCVLLDGCFTKDAFVLSSPPDKANLGRFWEMINENDASCIVMLNKAEDLPFADCFLPDDGCSLDCGRYTVYCDSVLIHPNCSFYVHNLSIVLNNNCNSANAVNSLRLYEFAKWPNSLEVPLIDAVLDLTINVADWNQRVGGGRPAVMFSIHGGDKARAALFSITWMMIDPIQYDGVVDVYSAARYVYSYMPIAITSVEQYHFLYRVMEEHVIRIETQKWRPEKVSKSVLPSVMLKTYTSDTNGNERLRSKSPCMTGKRRKRVKRLSSDGCAFQSLRKKKRGSKCVRVDENVSAGDSSTDGDQGKVDGKRKLGTGADCKGLSASAAAEESNKRWQSPDKTGKWAYPDTNNDTLVDAQAMASKTPKDASIDESKRGLRVPGATPEAEKKLEATSPAKKVADDRKNCLAKQVLPPETQMKQAKPVVKPVTPKSVKYEPSDVLKPSSSDRRLQPEVAQPSVKSPVDTKQLAPTSAPVDVCGRSTKVTQRQPSLTGTSSDELPPTSKKIPVTSPTRRMRCTCKLLSNPTGSPTRRIRCRCKMTHDTASINSAPSDDSDKQRPTCETDTINTTARPATAEGRAKSQKVEVPNYGCRSKKKPEALSDEDRYKRPEKSPTKTEKKRRGLSPGRGKPGFRFVGASSSDEECVAAARRGQSPKRPGLKQQGVLFKKSSSLERRIRRKSPSRTGKYSPRFDEKDCRPVSPTKKPSGAYSRTRFSNEKTSKRYPSRTDRNVTAAQPASLMTFKDQNIAYSRETRNRVPDQSPGKSGQERLEKPSGKSALEGRNSPTNLSPTGKKVPSAYTSSQSDDIENLSPSIGPKQKIQTKSAARSPAEDERVRRRRSPERSSSQEDTLTRKPRQKDGNTKGPRSRCATDSKTVEQTPSLEEKPHRVNPPTSKIQTQISQSQEPSSVSKRQKLPTALSKEEQISRPLSQFTSERRGRTSPVYVGSPKRSLSPAQSSFRGDKSLRHWTTDQKRSRRSPSRRVASPKRSRLSSRSSSRDRSSGNCTSGGEKPVETSNRREVSGLRVPRPTSRPNQDRAARSLGKSSETNNKDQISSAKMPPQKDGATSPLDTTFSKDAMSSVQVSSTKSDKTKMPPSKDESTFPTDTAFSKEADVNAVSSVPMSCSRPGKTKMTPPKDGSTLPADTTFSIEANVNAVSSVQMSCTRPAKTKMPTPKDESTLPADTTFSKEAGVNALILAQMLSTKPDKTMISGEDKPPTRYEASQQPKLLQPLARAKPSAVGCDIEQQITDAPTPNVTKNTAYSRAEEKTAVKDEVQAKLNFSLSDLSIDTRLTVERAQARADQKDSKMQDQQPEAKPRIASSKPQDVKQVLRMDGNQNPPQSTIPATRDANAPPPPQPKEATAPCSKLSAKAPVEDISFEDLLDGLFYTSSVLSTKSGPSTDTKQPCQAGLKSGQSKAVDSSLSPERNAGIQSASPKSDASPKPGVAQAACCSASPASVGQGVHSKDTDIPYVDDTDSGSVHEWRQK